MGLRDIEYRYTYDSDTSNLVEEFYDPVLSQAIEYKRIAGFFSSTCFAVVAEGVRGLIDNGGVMKMIVSPRISKNDADIIKMAYENPEGLISRLMIESIDSAKDALEKDCLSAMGWMIVHGLLEIKIAIVYDDDGKLMTCEEIEEKGLFHIKAGIITDANGDVISFSGSINETVSGWIKNAEQFEVHRMWIPGQEGYCKDQIQRFDEYWSGSRGFTKVYSIPDAVKKKFLENAVDDIEQIECLKKYKKNRLTEKSKKKEIKSEIDLYFYQNDAFNMWIENGYKMLFQMATGTGKTRTAIACMHYMLKTIENLMVVIVCPQNTLSLQWKAEIENLKAYDGTMIIADSSNGSKWRGQLEECILNISLGLQTNAIVFACSKTFCSRDFVSLISTAKDQVKYLIIGDEAHGLGASETSKGLLDMYEYRIGLSATPSRWFDDYGTRIIENYFGNKTFEFSIYQALHTEKPGTGKNYLTPYKYVPVFVHLTEDETYSYEEATKKITKARHFKDNDEDAQKRYEMLLMARADIYKNAENKYAELERILDDIKDNMEDTIIFVSDEQIDKVVGILSRRNISAKRYTEDTGSRPLRKYKGKTERQYVIDEFTDHTVQVLVAIKCLDEGIDIPSAKRAIIMASSSNPREFIQRVGRVIRISEGKDLAEIYDMTVVPDVMHLKSDLLKFELDVFDKEQNRIFDISQNSVNSVEVLRKIDAIQRRVHGWK